MNKLAKLLNTMDEGRNSNSITTVADLRSNSSNFGSTVTFGKDKTSLLQKGHATDAGKTVMIFTILEDGKFSDLAGTVKSELVYKGEELTIELNTGKLVSIKSDRNGITAKEGVDILIELLQNDRVIKGVTQAHDFEEFASALGSVINLVSIRGTISSSASEYGNTKRAIIKKFG